jgi:hypothetical protein
MPPEYESKWLQLYQPLLSEHHLAVSVSLFRIRKPICRRNCKWLPAFKGVPFNKSGRQRSTHLHVTPAPVIVQRASCTEAIKARSPTEYLPAQSQGVIYTNSAGTAPVLRYFRICVSAFLSSIWNSHLTDSLPDCGFFKRFMSSNMFKRAWLKINKETNMLPLSR